MCEKNLFQVNIYHTKISMNMCLNDHSRSSPRTFWALSPPCILENLFIPWDQKWDEIVVAGFFGSFSGATTYSTNHTYEELQVTTTYFFFFSHGETPGVQTPVPATPSYSLFINVMGPHSLSLHHQQPYYKPIHGSMVRHPKLRGIWIQV